MAGPLDRRDAAPLAPLVLGGALVRLEPLSPAHLGPLIEAAGSDPAEVFPFTHVPRDRAGMTRYLEVALGLAAAGQALRFATLEAASGLLVGTTGYCTVERWDWFDGVERRPAGGVDSIEIGYTWLARRAQRTGINTEAKYLLLRHAFEVLRVHRLQLKTDARNQRSRDAIARLGARFEGVLRSHRPSAEDGLRDTAMFSVVEAEWPAVRARLEGLLARGPQGPFRTQS
jgi:RimJ/RimL family protein N-acetyltransferase